MTRRYASRPAAAALLAALGLASAGCEQPGADEALPPLSTGSPRATFAPASPTPEPTPETTLREVPRTCGALVPTTEVLRIVGVPLRGEGTFVYAGPIPDSGRTGRITCGYGAAPRPGDADGDADGLVPKVEITVNGYVDAATAATRLDASVESARTQGETLAAYDLAGRRGVLFQDDVDRTYVVVDAERTVVVSLRHGVVPAQAARPVLVELAAAVLGLPASAAATGTPAQ